MAENGKNDGIAMTDCLFVRVGQLAIGKGSKKRNNKRRLYS